MRSFKDYLSKLIEEWLYLVLHSILMRITEKSDDILRFCVLSCILYYLYLESFCVVILIHANKYFWPSQLYKTNIYFKGFCDWNWFSLMIWFSGKLSLSKCELTFLFLWIMDLCWFSYISEAVFETLLRVHFLQIWIWYQEIIRNYGIYFLHSRFDFINLQKT